MNETFHRIGDRYFNLAKIATVDLYQARGNKPPGVLITTEVGYSLEYGGGQAEAIRDYFERRCICKQLRLADGLTIVEVSPPEAAVDDTPGLGASPLSAALAALQCQAELDRYAARPGIDGALDRLTDILARHGWEGGTYTDAREFTRRKIAEAHIATAPATAEAAA